MNFHYRKDLKPHELIEGYQGRFVHSDRMTVAHWDIKAGYEVPEHTHENEMVINVVEGQFEVTVDDETKVLGPGDVAIVPSFARHKARAITDCRCIDVFSPVREPYKV
ncbi:cupin domain-containing protein [Ferruginivarius sediminum]|jgi:quercetin dioxygenase-like cupin family protein|uniref:Cupin domain-containing protein n=1 Tax=Ferruginivarius sediminum TaxID=2661937 RepID=A0A369T7S0_9PROT|nr:cupin domain-containing protein [Ferruginivarius sediminum]RDD61371.1 cupin domain-containing protein [Ferruginivarius sediminum]